MSDFCAVSHGVECWKQRLCGWRQVGPWRSVLYFGVTDPPDGSLNGFCPIVFPVEHLFFIIRHSLTVLGIEDPEVDQVQKSWPLGVYIVVGSVNNHEYTKVPCDLS